MLRARVLLIAVVVGATAGPTLPVLTPRRPAYEFAMLPRAIASPPTTVGREVVATVTEIPAATTTTATPRPRSTPKPPVGDGKDDKNNVDTRPKPKPAGLPLGSPFVGKYVGTEIEGFARYEGQTTCDPTPKPGTVALRDLLLARYPNTTSLGTSRACDVGGQSEHKEGRAFDWGANVANAAQAAAVNDFITALFATDAAGHPYALARRMGVMYVIWNHQIWNSGHPAWESYDGANPHTDHVHISLSWAGARAETSFWSGSVLVPERLTTTTTRGPRSTTTSRPTTTSTTRGPRFPRPSTTTTSSTSTSSTTTVPSTTTSTTLG